MNELDIIDDVLSQVSNAYGVTIADILINGARSAFCPRAMQRSIWRRKDRGLKRRISAEGSEGGITRPS